MSPGKVVSSVALLLLATSITSSSATAVKSMPSVLLKNAAKPNVQMPAIGLGTGGYGNSKYQPMGKYPECWSDGQPDFHGYNQGANCSESVIKAVMMYLKAGGRRIDNSDSYENYRTVGKAIVMSKVPRKEIFITSKVGNGLPMGYNETLEQVDDILKAYQTSYVDLVLIHWPTTKRPSSDPACGSSGSPKACRAVTYKALLERMDKGDIRAVGVSNWNLDDMKEFGEMGLTLPAVNQIPYNPHLAQAQKELVEFCQKNNVLVNSYSPLGIPDWHMYSSNISTTGKIIEEPKIKAIADRLKCTPPQVLLAHQWAKGIVSNPRSMVEQHMIDNMNSVKCKLTQDDMNVMESFKQDECTDSNKWYECCGDSTVQASIPSCGSKE